MWNYKVSHYTVGLVGLNTIGFLLSLYTSYVELNAENDRQYKALCDINEHISCTKVFTTSYGRGFGIISQLLGKDSILNAPNGFFGVFYYFLVTVISFGGKLHIARLNFYLILISNLMSLYLAYLLVYVINVMCIVCVITYVINFVSLLLALKKIDYMKARGHMRPKGE